MLKKFNGLCFFFSGTIEINERKYEEWASKHILIQINFFLLHFYHIFI